MKYLAMHRDGDLVPYVQFHVTEGAMRLWSIWKETGRTFLAKDMLHVPRDCP